MRPRINDLVIVVPGIAGSVLTKDGRDVWAASSQAVWGAFKSLGHSLAELHLGEDDPDQVDLGDGVIADRVITDVHLIPGISKIDGYSGLINLVTKRFEVIKGDRNDPAPANFFLFPYDWRRDNRVSAAALKRFVDDRLAVWRTFTGNDEARVILLAHSMGGIVSRYYLEVLGGREDARALITFGTPFRGSPKAIGALSNGIKKAWLDLSDMIRSFTSVYQLLPIYRSISSAGEWWRPAELDIPGIDADQAVAALGFHRRIEESIESNGPAGYATLPFVGFRQTTPESATLANGKLTAVDSTPAWIDRRLGGGDGTVPMLSAIPIEMSTEFADTHVAERHSSLQNSGRVLDDIEQRLRRLSARGLESIRGPEQSDTREAAPAIGIEIDDVYELGESARVDAQLWNVDTDEVPAATLRPADPAVSLQTVQMEPSRFGWSAAFETRVSGIHRIEVSLKTHSGADPDPVHDVFEVLE